MQERRELLLIIDIVGSVIRIASSRFQVQCCTLFSSCLHQSTSSESTTLLQPVADCSFLHCSSSRTMPSQLVRVLRLTEFKQPGKCFPLRHDCSP
jgi:hypothetical protein